MLKSMKYNEKIMLGEPIGEMKGKITSQRVIDVEGPTMEYAYQLGAVLRECK